MFAETVLPGLPGYLDSTLFLFTQLGNIHPDQGFERLRLIYFK
jgi:hypothetical protein